MKICTKCKIEKSLSEFYKHPGCKKGVGNSCKLCTKIQSLKYRKDNAEKIKEKGQRYRLLNKEKTNEYTRNWYNRNKDEIRVIKKESMKKRRDENPEIHRIQTKRAKSKLKDSLFDIYGHACARCGFDDKRALTLDHKLNNGNKERRELGERGVYRRARDNYLPDEYQTLCMNCQFIKRVEDKNQNQHE
jgi:hypothetical protein